MRFVLPARVVREEFAQGSKVLCLFIYFFIAPNTKSAESAADIHVHIPMGWGVEYASSNVEKTSRNIHGAQGIAALPLLPISRQVFHFHKNPTTSVISVTQTPVKTVFCQNAKIAPNCRTQKARNLFQNETQFPRRDQKGESRRFTHTSERTRRGDLSHLRAVVAAPQRRQTRSRESIAFVLGCPRVRCLSPGGEPEPHLFPRRRLFPAWGRRSASRARRPPPRSPWSPSSGAWQRARSPNGPRSISPTER